jgi:hypothetical protein
MLSEKLSTMYFQTMPHLLYFVTATPLIYTAPDMPEIHKTTQVMDLAFRLHDHICTIKGNLEKQRTHLS